MSADRTPREIRQAYLGYYSQGDNIIEAGLARHLRNSLYHKLTVEEYDELRADIIGLFHRGKSLGYGYAKEATQSELEAEAYNAIEARVKRDLIRLINEGEFE